jgi:hypothetical protein
VALDFLRELDRFEQIAHGYLRCAGSETRDPRRFFPESPTFSQCDKGASRVKQINERYWKSKFARFVKTYGVDELAVQLDVLPSAIYHWIRGATTPRPTHAAIIQRLARERGSRLTMDQIYGHSLSLRAAKFPSEPFLEASASARISAG